MTMNNNHVRVAGLALVAWIVAAPVHAQWNREAEEDAVYRVALRQMFDKSAKFVLVDSVPSSKQTEPIRDPKGAPIAAPDSLMAELAADYKTANQSKRSLRSLGQGNDLVFVPESAIAGTEALSGAFVTASSLVKLSRPGFSADRRTAMVYVEGSCGGRCGQWGVMILVKEGDRWRFDRYLWALIA
jgi:hypothetical protein